MSGYFDLTKRLGAGNFGEVWLATDLRLGVERAVKLIPPDKIPDPKNFFREAQILKTAEHPNIVKVEGAGEFPDGRIYVAMEYINAGSLEDSARGGLVHLTRAKALMIDVLRGLHHAHLQGIIHRDIKPANILIGASREGKLSDFGLAMDIHSGSQNPQVHYVPHLAPEVISNNSYSVKSDIYAAGATYYRLVNGDSYLPGLSPSFSMGEMVQRILDGEYPNRKTYREYVPRQMVKIINKAMSIDPAKRYKSAQTMRHAIEQVHIHMNWNVKRFSDRIVWTSSFGPGIHFEVIKGQSTNGKWFVTTRRGRSSKTLRRLTSCCLKNVNEKMAEKTTRKILQEIVLGKIT